MNSCTNLCHISFSDLDRTVPVYIAAFPFEEEKRKPNTNQPQLKTNLQACYRFLMKLQHKSLGDGFIYAHFNDTFTTFNQFYAVFDRVKVVSYWLGGKSQCLIKKMFSWKKIRIWAKTSNLDFRHVTFRMFGIS